MPGLKAHGLTIPPGPAVWGHSVNALSGQANATPANSSTTYLTAFPIMTPCTITTLHLAVGNPGGTDNTILSLFDYTGRLVANTDDQGTLVGSADSVQAINLEAPFKLVVPGVYVVGAKFSGTATRFRAYSPTGMRVPVGTHSGSAFPAVETQITVPTGWTSGVGPVIFTS